jgi:hypothetical protein
MIKKLSGMTMAFLLVAGFGAASASAELPSQYSTKKPVQTFELPSQYSTTELPSQYSPNELPSQY